MNRADRLAALRAALDRRILVLDGAMGTRIQELGLTALDYGDFGHEGCHEVLSLTKTDIIRSIHESYLEAGCDIIETNSFGATPLVLKEYSLEDCAHEINFSAARIAREAADRLSTLDRPRFVAGSMGPTNKSLSVTGGISFDELMRHYQIQAGALWEGGADFLLLETCHDTLNIKAALCAVDERSRDLGTRIPVAVSVTIQPGGTMLAGQDIEAVVTSLSHRELLYLGINCSTGAAGMTDLLRSLSLLSPFPVACVPNAGLPDDSGKYGETPQTMAATMARFIANEWVNLIGGCCGSHAGHIAELVRVSEGAPPRIPPSRKGSWLGGIKAVDIGRERKPVVAGERANVIGSRKFKELVCAERFDEAVEIALEQERHGASVIDICMANPERSEPRDMRSFLEKAARALRSPVMIDSTDPAVIELALKFLQGKAIINSINLENGEDRFRQVVPLALKYGAALVVGTIDDDPAGGMALSRDRKLAIAERSYKLLVSGFGFREEDIYFDPLTFPCAAAAGQYSGSAVETIEGLRLIKSEFPKTRSVLGISNVSFGLPPAGREVLGSVFLHHATQAGLDLAIANPMKTIAPEHIPPHERELAENLLFQKGDDPAGKFVRHFRINKEADGAPSGIPRDSAPVDLKARLAALVTDGTRTGLKDLIDEALELMSPQQIISGPLMSGMDEVGRQFGAGRKIISEVLRSAEVMKAAAQYLEPLISNAGKQTIRGRMLLATVKGDVHDIGKNLVHMILANNGFEISDLGVRVPASVIAAEAATKKPDMIGLSGLLLKSAEQMVLTAKELSQKGIKVPVLVGGAALSEGFVRKSIVPAYDGPVYYCKDAMAGLDIANRIASGNPLPPAAKQTTVLESTENPPPQSAAPASATRPLSLGRVSPVPSPKVLGRQVIRNFTAEQVWKFINPMMFYGRHLGIKGDTVRMLEKAGGDPKALAEMDPHGLETWKAVQDIKAEYIATPFIRPSAVHGFFRATGAGNAIHILDETGREHMFGFTRQQGGEGLCLADYLDEKSDTLGLFVVTAGQDLRGHVEELKARGAYLKAHILQVLAIESAEAFAELLHAQMRRDWNFPDPPGMTMLDRFQYRYQGRRYSFGYPACPDLSMQKTLFEILKPGEIGVSLTESFMMEPEASVSSLVFHHPGAVYFSVSAPPKPNGVQS